MAESCTIQVKDDRPRHSMALIRVDCVCDTDGTFDMALDVPMFGSIMHFVTKPGSPAPTDASDITLTDQNGFDMFNGLGTDKVDNTDTLMVPVMTEATVGGRYYGVNPSIAYDRPILHIVNNSVNGAKVTVWIYLR